MRLPTVTTLLSNRIERWRWSVAGPDDCIYGTSAQHVVKFNPVDNSITEIGPDLGDRKWDFGVLAGNNCIYCLPDPIVTGTYSVLKIDTVRCSVTLLGVELPGIEIESDNWKSGALAIDGCIYFMPCCAQRVLKLDPEDDTVSLVGEDIGDLNFDKFETTIAANDGWLYGIPGHFSCIVRFNPLTKSTSVVGEGDLLSFKCLGCFGGGVVGRDGNIYAFNYNEYRVLKIDTKNSCWSYVGNAVEKIEEGEQVFQWGHAIFGSDGCIYWPPLEHNLTLKFDPETERTSLVGHFFHTNTTDVSWKWMSGALMSDGRIYCLPSFCANQVLVIDPWREFKMTLQADLEQYPEELGRLFVRNEHGKTTYEAAVTKFGIKKVFQAIQNYVPSHVVFQGTNLASFLVTALCENSELAMIHFMLMENLDSFLPLLSDQSNPTDD